MKTHLIIEQILKNQPTTRANDKLLRLKVYEAYGLYLSETQRQRFMSLPSDESITRIRRKLQENGNYAAPETIRRARKIKALQTQQRMPGTAASKVEQVVEQRITLFQDSPVRSIRYVH